MKRPEPTPIMTVNLLFTRLSVVVFLCFVVSSALEEQGEILSYNNSTKQLHFRCPKEPIVEGNIAAILLTREDQNLKMAKWGPNSGTATEALIDRVEALPSAFPQRLEAVLNNVTCYDASVYMCKYTVSQHGARAIHKIERQKFVFDGVASQPVLKVEPRQARYAVGDSILLTCKAVLCPHDNAFVWETRLPGEPFQPIHRFPKPSSTDEVEQNANSCEVTSTTYLTHVLSADDDNREWRCKLRLTQQEDVFAAAVQCIDGATGCSAEVDSHTVFILVAIIAILFSSMVITVAILVTKHRQKQKKSPVILYPPTAEPPLSSPICHEASNNNNVAIQSRDLPPPPPIQSHSHRYPNGYAFYNGGHYHSHDDDQISEDPDNTPPKMVSPYNASMLSSQPTHHSSSVYISMAAVPPLQETGSGSGPGDKMFLVIDRPEKPSDGRDAGFGRSQSVYSNKEAIDRERSSSSAASHESHVTLGNLKEWRVECGRDLCDENPASNGEGREGSECV